MHVGVYVGRLQSRNHVGSAIAQMVKRGRRCTKPSSTGCIINRSVVLCCCACGGSGSGVGCVLLVASLTKVLCCCGCGGSGGGVWGVLPAASLTGVLC
jgi:hypothetical protein